MPEWIKQWRNAWSGVMTWLAGFVAVNALSFLIAALSVERGPGSEYGHRVFALAVAIDMTLFTLAIVFFFFYVFRGTEATKTALEDIITYCYAFLAFSLAVSILPFVILPHVPAAMDIMKTSPIGILKGCSALPDDAQAIRIPGELKCGTHADQWVVNIGGLIVEPASSAEPRDGASQRIIIDGDTDADYAGRARAYRAALHADDASAGQAQPNAHSFPPVNIQGGLVVPLYVVVLSLMGATVSMTRRVPEFQRRMTPGDPEFMTYDAARESIVFQIMQVASAPLIAVTSYYIVEPSTRGNTILLAFASGFSSEVILLFIRAGLEKLRPNVGNQDADKSTHVSASPDRLDFGDVAVGTTVTKVVAITNPTTIDLNLTSTNCTGEFSTPPNFPQRVPAGSSVSISISFAPVSPGAKSAVLTITDNGVGSPRTVSLSGNGVPPAADAATHVEPQLPRPDGPGGLSQQRPQNEQD